LNAAIRLSERGCSIDIVTLEPIEQKFAPLPDLPTSINIIQLKRARNSFKLLHRILLKTGGTRSLNSALDVLDFIRAAIVVARRKKTYDLVIGIDAIGILLSRVSKTKAAATSVYWSLELNFVSTALIGRIAKYFEHQLIRQVSLIVVQDRNRAAFLMQRFAFDESRVRLVPNSAMGRPKLQCPAFLKKRLNLDPACRIILHAGMICDEALSTELAASAADWPDGYLLVFHEREIRDSGEPYLQGIVASGRNRVALSLAPVRLDEVDKVYSSAFIGIVMYSTEHGPNVSEIAYASGKLSYFLRNGIPIIVNANPSLMSFVSKWRCGLVAKDFGEIGYCISEIEKDYELYKKHALECFTKFLDFQVAFDEAFDSFLAPDEHVAERTQ